MRVSVFITSYNQKKWLKEAVESVLSQSLRPDQIIIVDDCSSDGSRELIGGFTSNYPDLIIPILHSTNLGVTQSRIDALEHVTGDFATYVDGDDRFFSGKLEMELNALLSNPHVDIAFSNYCYANSIGDYLDIWSDTDYPPDGDVALQTIARDFPRRNLFRFELVNYRAWKRIGFHDPKLQMYEDWEMRIRLTRRLRTVYVDQPLSLYRLHHEGLSRKSKLEHLEAVDYIIDKHSEWIHALPNKQRVYVRHNLKMWRSKIVLRFITEKMAEEKYSCKSRSNALNMMISNASYFPRVLALKTLLRILFPFSHRL